MKQKNWAVQNYFIKGKSQSFCYETLRNTCIKVWFSTNFYAQEATTVTN